LLEDDELAGLRLKDLVVLAGLVRLGNARINALAKRLGLRRWRVKTALRRLTARGLAVCDDGTFRPTPAGKKLAPNALAALVIADFRPELLSDLESWERNDRTSWPGELRW
jgi:DNA-binding MarR family transcriptional regulator